MTAARHLRDGQTAERRALELLTAHGLDPVARNYRCRVGELDLVMLDDRSLVVVEVRFRRNRRFGGAAASIDGRKLGKLRSATQHFLLTHPELRARPVRFDVVTVEADAEAGDIDWMRGAFDGGGR